MKPPQRAPLQQLGFGLRTARERLERLAGRDVPMEPSAGGPVGTPAASLETAREFQRRVAAIIDTVQLRIWERGVHELLGYATDFAVGQHRGAQTLVLKTARRSTYLRLDWDTLTGDAEGVGQRVEEAVRVAVDQLA